MKIWKPTTAQEFFGQIVYSSANEDGRSEIAALAMTSSDRVVAITGSGARALDLLLGNPREVVAVDFNPKQNFLLELKIAAYRHLNYEEFESFLGLKASSARSQAYQGLRTYLSKPAREFFDSNPRLLKDGVLYCGAWERYFKIFSWLLLPRRRTLTKLFAARNLSEQNEIWQKNWSKGIWNWGMVLLSSPLVWKYVLREPGIYSVPGDFDISRYLKQRFDHAAQHFLFRETPYMSLLLRGRYDPQESLPLHLQRQNFATIRDRLDRISLHTGSLTEFLSAVENAATIDCFSLSDTSSYANGDEYQLLWEGVLASARPQARFCERHFLVKFAPHLAQGRILRNEDLEARLSQSDNTFIYSFVAGTVS